MRWFFPPVILIELLLVGYVASTCPAHSYRHTYYSNMCIMMNPNGTQPNSLTDARNYCIRRNAEILSPYNHVIHEYVQQKIPDVFGCGSFEHAYVGLNQTWFWDNGRAATYRNWDGDQPKNPGNSQKDCPMIGGSLRLEMQRCDKTTVPICQYTDTNDTVHIALVDGTEELNGRVEVFRDGIWGPVCSKTMPNITDLAGVCTMLGFKPRRMLDIGEFRNGTGYPMSEGLVCLENYSENATTLDDCLVSNITDITCTVNETIGVQCDYLTYNDTCPRLASGKDPCPTDPLVCETVGRCLCLETHYWNGTECFPKQGYNGPCMDPPYGDNPCLLDLICVDEICKCIRSKYWNVTLSQCETIPYVPVVLEEISVVKKKQTTASDKRTSAKVMGLTICATIFSILGAVLVLLDVSPDPRPGHTKIPWKKIKKQRKPNKKPPEKDSTESSETKNKEDVDPESTPINKACSYAI